MEILAELEQTHEDMKTAGKARFCPVRQSVLDAGSDNTLSVTDSSKKCELQSLGAVTSA